MAEREPLTIDISDANAIRDALLRAEREVGVHDARVREALEDLRYWQTMHDRLAGLADNGSGPRQVAAESVRKRLRRYINESPIPVEVDLACQLLPHVKRKTITWTLWDLARKGEIQKISEGLYAAVEFQPSTLLGGAD